MPTRAELIVACIGCIIEFIGAIFIAFILFYLIKNLYIANHNWIIEPSSINKKYAIASPSFIVLARILYLIMIPLMTFLDCSSLHYFADSIIITLGMIGQRCYFLYLLTTLEYQIKAQEMIRNVVSMRWIYLVKLLIILSIFISIIAVIIYLVASNEWDYDQIPYTLLTTISGTICKLLTEIILCYLYIKGLNNISHFWYSKQWREYQKYGSIDKVHETLIVMTRCTVIIIISMITSILCSGYGIVFNYIDTEYHLSEAYVILLKTIGALWDVLDDITYVVSIYFVYDFGYSSYRKWCNKCHLLLYGCYERRYQRQLESGAFNGNEWKSHKSTPNNKCCKCIKIREPQDQTLI